MSRITELFDAFEAVAEATLTGYTNMPNPYIPEENPTNLYSKMFGIQISSGDNTTRLAGCNKQSTARQIVLVLVNKITSTQNNQDSLSSKQVTMMEDLFSFIQAQCNDGTINNIASKNEFISDTGIGFVDAGAEKFYILEATFNYEYFDDL